MQIVWHGEYAVSYTHLGHGCALHRARRQFVFSSFPVVEAGPRWLLPLPVSYTHLIPVYSSAPAEGRRNSFIFSTEPIKPNGTGSFRRAARLQAERSTVMETFLLLLGKAVAFTFEGIDVLCGRTRHGPHH